MPGVQTLVWINRGSGTPFCGGHNQEGICGLGWASPLIGVNTKLWLPWPVDKEGGFPGS